MITLSVCATNRLNCLFHMRSVYLLLLIFTHTHTRASVTMLCIRYYLLVCANIICNLHINRKVSFWIKANNKALELEAKLIRMVPNYMDNSCVGLRNQFIIGFNWNNHFTAFDARHATIVRRYITFQMEIAWLHGKIHKREDCSPLSTTTWLEW